MKEQFEPYLQATYFLDAQHLDIQEYVADRTKGITSKTEQVLALYYAIRDEFRYDPYKIFAEKEYYVASHILQRNPKHGHCIDKAILLATCVRAVGVPSRLRFANVRNHIGTERIEKVLKTNVLVFHGSTDIYLNDKWVTATPAFNKELCERYQVAPLNFDGENDSLFQEYDHKQRKFMEYLHTYGHFPDHPFEMMLGEWKRYYPNAKLSDL